MPLLFSAGGRAVGEGLEAVGRFAGDIRTGSRALPAGPPPPRALTPGRIDNATPARFSVDANGTVTDLTAPAPLELAAPEFVNNAGAPIRSFVVEQDTVFFRVFSDPARQTGGFLVSTPPQSPSQAISSLALPPENSATLLQEVVVPAGPRLQSSIATDTFGQPGGALQFEILPQSPRIPDENFRPGVPF